MPEARLSIDGRAGGVALNGPGPWLLGRSQAAEVSFPDDRACSREQARIVRKGHGFAIQNLSQSTVTSLDGQVLAQNPAWLIDGNSITFGSQTIIFRLIDDEAAERTTIARSSDMATLPGQIRLERRLTVGRQSFPDQVVLDHPAVSRRHTVFERVDNAVLVRDLGSTNGTFVNGTRIDRPHRLLPGDRVDIGPFQLTYDGHGLSSAARNGNAELDADGVTADVRVTGSRTETIRILDNATFTIAPRELVGIIGSSGSGKSTLMNILAGRAAPSLGNVKLNGTDLHGSFDALKQDVAFVPQQDVLHEQLTLREALDYAAQLRLPADTSAEQRRHVVETAAANVDLAGRLDTKIAMLSGGQKKRASLASEILNRPSLLFLDEVTSGLDESTDWEIMRLLRRLADEGMTIVVVTHTLANLAEFCHKVVCMGRGGHTTFVGPPAKALTFFGVDRLGQIFNRIEAEGARKWRGRYEDEALETIMRPSAAAAISPVAQPAHRGESLSLVARRMGRQFVILTDRNARLLLADRQTLIMAAVQSCVIGALMGYAFGSFGTGSEAANGKIALLFLLGLTAIWIGCNGGSKEIVGELVIYKRERDINLSTAAFVASKFTVSLAFTIVQVIIVFLLTAMLAESIPGPFLPQLAIVIVASVSGTSIGLMVSALCNTRDQATTIVPLVLVPQIILAKVLVPHLPILAELVAKLAVSSLWITEAMKSVYFAKLPPPVPATDPAGFDLLVVVVQSLVFLGLAYAATLTRHAIRRNSRR